MSRKEFAVLRFQDAGGREQRKDLGANVTTLGRAEECTLVIQSRMVSHHHARIELHDDDYFLFDNDSTNGTFVNGQPIEAKHQLRSGDVIWLGTSDVSLRFVDPEETLQSASARRVPALAIDEASHVVKVHGVSIHLSPKEYGLLLYLADNYRKACSRKECYEAIWETKFEEGTCGDSFDATVAALRKKLKDAASQAGEPSPRITTLKKIGLRLDTNITRTGRHSGD